MMATAFSLNDVPKFYVLLCKNILISAILNSGGNLKVVDKFDHLNLEYWTDNYMKIKDFPFDENMDTFPEFSISSGRNFLLFRIFTTNPEYFREDKYYFDHTVVRTAPEDVQKRRNYESKRFLQFVGDAVIRYSVRKPKASSVYIISVTFKTAEPDGSPPIELKFRN